MKSFELGIGLKKNIWGGTSNQLFGAQSSYDLEDVCQLGFHLAGTTMIIPSKLYLDIV